MELKPVRKVNADASLKRFQLKVVWARRQPTSINIEFRVAEPIALPGLQNTNGKFMNLD